MIEERRNPGTVYQLNYYSNESGSSHQAIGGVDACGGDAGSMFIQTTLSDRCLFLRWTLEISVVQASIVRIRA
jgi:hypothetical protein